MAKNKQTASCVAFTELIKQYGRAVPQRNVHEWLEETGDPPFPCSNGGSGAVVGRHFSAAAALQPASRNARGESAGSHRNTSVSKFVHEATTISS